MTAPASVILHFMAHKLNAKDYGFFGMLMHPRDLLIAYPYLDLFLVKASKPAYFSVDEAVLAICFAMAVAAFDERETEDSTQQYTTCPPTLSRTADSRIIH